MKTTLPSPTKRKADMDWAKTPYPNLIRYKPSGNYFGRVRVNGKLIRRSLETHVLTVAKLKLSDFLQDHRRLAVNKGQSVNGEVIIEMFKKEIEYDHNNKSRTKLYKVEISLLPQSRSNILSGDMPSSSNTSKKIQTFGLPVARSSVLSSLLPPSPDWMSLINSTISVRVE